MICAACGVETSTDPCGSCAASARLDGRFTLLRALGEGAAAVTWLARDAAGELVTVKELRVTANDELIEKFHRDARVASELHHPGIPEYVEEFGLGGRDRVLCVVRRYIDGETLADVVGKRAFAIDEALALVEQVLEPLGYLHARSIVHRDLTPSNIVVRPDGSVAILDFGTAHDARHGPPAYTSPEQLAGDATPASDIFALGVLLVALLSGKDPADLVKDERRLDWRPHVRTQNRWIALIGSMLADDPADRPANAAHLAEAIATARSLAATLAPAGTRGSALAEATVRTPEPAPAHEPQHRPPVPPLLTTPAVAVFALTAGAGALSFAVLLASICWFW